MRRLAVFVEGQTERVFADRLLMEMAGAKRLEIIQKRFHGGKRFPRISYLIGNPNETRSTNLNLDEDVQFQALLYDCGGENRITSDIRDQYESLEDAGYWGIIGIRDVRPNFSRRDVPKIYSGFDKAKPHGKVNVSLVLAIMEIEAWILAEHTHFARLSPKLTADRIAALLKFDPRTDDVELRDVPSNDLLHIYGTININYDKSLSVLNRIFGKVDFSLYADELKNRIANVKTLVDVVDEFFT